MKRLIIFFSRADENYAVGYIDKGNTEIAAEYVQGKTVRVISTHEGSGLGSMATDVKKMCKGANVDSRGLAIKGSQAKDSKDILVAWL